MYVYKEKEALYMVGTHYLAKFKILNNFFFHFSVFPIFFLFSLFFPFLYVQGIFFFLNLSGNFVPRITPGRQL